MHKRLLEIYRQQGFMGSIRALLLYPLRFVYYRTGFRKWWLGDHWLIGKLVELKGNTVTIEGLRFNVGGPGISTAIKSRFLLDRYEKEEREILHSTLDPNLPVIELGACIGVISCITNSLLKNPKRHVVVEANPRLLPILAENRERNKCEFTIVPKAVGSEETVTFYLHDKFVGGSANRKTGEEVVVPAITLPRILEEARFPVVTLICDIEGGEVALIKENEMLFRERIALFMAEFHPAIVGNEGIESARKALERIGFVETKRVKSVSVYKNTGL